MTNRFDQDVWICDAQYDITMGGKGSGSTTSTSTSSPPPEVMAQYNNVIGQANNTASQPLNLYGGQMVAPFTGMQNAAFDSINQAQGMSQPYINQATSNLNNSTQDIWNQAQQFSPQSIQQYMSPYTQQVVDASRANMNENDAQQQNDLRGRAISAGAFGGDRAGVASAELSRQQKLADDANISNLYNQAYTSGLGAFQQQQGQQLNSLSQNAALNQAAAGQYAGLGTTAMNNALNGANSQLNAGTLQQQLNQAALNVPYQQYTQQQAFPYQNTQWLANTSLGLGQGMGGTSTTTQPSANGSSQTLGNIIGLAGTAASIFSDRRVKKDIKHVGQAGDYPVYTYKYKGHDKPQIGVMAQDVEKINPDAVGEVNGIKTVDYSKLADGGVPGSVDPNSIFNIPNQGLSYIPDFKASMGINGLPATPQTVQQPQQSQGLGDTGTMGLKNIQKALKKPSTDTGMAARENDLHQDMDAEKPRGLDDVMSDLKSSGAHDGFFSGLGDFLSRPAEAGMSSAIGPVAQDVDISGFLSGLGFADGGITGLPTDEESLAQQAMRQSMVQQDVGAEDAQNQDMNNVDLAQEPQGIGLPEAPAPQTLGPVDAPEAAPTAAEDAQPSDSIAAFKEDPALAIAAAGFGMAAGNSHSFGQNVGAGALAGIQNWQSQKKMAHDDAQLRALTAYRNATLEKGKMEVKTDPMNGELMVIDKTTGKAVPLNGNGGGAPSGSSIGKIIADNPDATGKDFLDTLRKEAPAKADTIKKIAEGDMAFPSAFALSKPYWRDIMEGVFKYDPGANQNRMAVMKAFNTGKESQAVKSFGVGISHLNTLEGLAGALGNGDAPAINKVANAWKEQTGSTAPTNFDTAKQIVGDEIIKAVVGAQGALGDRDKAQAVLDKAKTFDQLKGVIHTYKLLMNGQLGGLKNQYEVGTGRDDFLSRLPKEARDSFANEGAAPSTKTVSMDTLKAAAAKSGKTIDDLKKDAMAKGYTVQ